MCISKSIWLTCIGKEIYHFAFVLLCIRGQTPSTSPQGAYINFGGAIQRRVSCVTILGDLYYFGEAYTWGGLFSEFYGIFIIDSLPSYQSYCLIL